ncbi:MULTISPECIES: Mrp/NBP35 family ATP-binding protein [Rhodomicrobium]|uniref:Mrp/NBP35 family ATP-binding protein n=1 Tax=Rhodomicrobium TaxID=1068 RepID=UPI000B4B9CDF|nr:MULTISPECIES: Mrp/NBP35 family ATP-binding protein [Rhodomicrobium]
MTPTPAKEKIIAELKRVKGPDGTGDIVSLNLVSEILVQDGKVYFSIAVPPARAKELEPLRERAERAAAMVPGVKAVMATLTADRPAGKPSGAAQAPHQHQHPPQPAARAPLHGIENVKRIIAVASGKGGVGKSTTAVNLALAMQVNGLRVGLLDADIYGPSVPRLMGLSGKPELLDNKTLIPMRNYGIKVMSIGFLVEEDTPMIWRGPMVMSALTQMLRDVEWGDLDIMVVDMPPGTGDAQLTMAQQVPLAGAVIVSTPQDLALIDARKGLNMFKRVNVPVLGIVENMSYFLCPKCGERSEIFSHGGGKAEAERLGVPFLGEVPLDMVIRETSDGGFPVVVSHTESPHSAVYRDIAARVWASVSDEKQQRTAPRIVIE